MCRLCLLLAKLCALFLYHQLPGWRYKLLRQASDLKTEAPATCRLIVCEMPLSARGFCLGADKLQLRQVVGVGVVAVAVVVACCKV